MGLSLEHSLICEASVRVVRVAGMQSALQPPSFSIINPATLTALTNEGRGKFHNKERSAIHDL